MLKAVLFDLDNTLVGRDRAFRECVCAQFSDPAVRSQLFRLDQGVCGDRDALFQCWQRHSGTSMNQALLGRLLAERLQPDHGLLQALHALSRHVQLGIITNGGSDTQRRKFQAAGLEAVIPHGHLWISGEVGKAKPDPAIFLLASRTLGVAPETCLFIGDREQEDQAGATAAGMRARRVGAVLNGEQLNALIREEEELGDSSGPSLPVGTSSTSSLTFIQDSQIGDAVERVPT
ncbi:MAG TPA: HAD family hydrolase [Candidatus Sulfotelmatobacter sp.]|nr:HAD family hydrolase [Candidatus Sulfotelmatobacter sp.]